MTRIATDVAIVVPTRNEADNVAPLVHRLDHALNGQRVEIIFVDDSDDATPERIRAVALTSNRDVRVVHRAPDDRAGGLGTAVLTGLRAARAEWAVVMDGDLQHPPEVVPELVRAGQEKSADVVVASRYVGNGSASGLSSAARGWVSHGTTTAARTFFPRRVGSCTDPMSGFFAVRLAGLDMDALRPNGFKILLEILARSRKLYLAEVPFVFDARHSGESKASWREGVLFVRRLLSLRFATLLGRHGDRVAKAFGFAAVGLSGVAVNTLALWLMVRLLSTPLLLGASVATQASTIWNFVLTDRYVFRGRKTRSLLVRFIGFAVLNNAVLLLRLPLLSWLVNGADMHYVIANVLTLIAAFVCRFLLSDRILFKLGGEMTDVLDHQEVASAGESGGPSDGRSGPVDLVVDVRVGADAQVRRRPQALQFRYDVHGIVTIGSVIPLPELESFRTSENLVPDIEVCRGTFGTGRPRRRPRVTQYAVNPAVSYEEHLGRRGSDFHVEMGDRIRIVIGPMLARSPHVLYTNVIEALLRFVFASRGYMLLHSACLDFNGHGMMLSALTDTGKTGTVLRLLREGGGRFLSDDMTIIDGNGIALSYPKPLTISQHTLRAVNAGDLTPWEWRSLRIQSRVHSKEGRGIGTRLGDMNVPIMSLNAVTQCVVPPPKYNVQRLVTCELARSVQVEQLFVIERGPDSLADIDRDGLIDELIANTDDAYGFPPFRYFAPALVVDGLPYEELRARERAILVQAMQRVRARRLATPDFTWADHIPGLATSDSMATVSSDEVNGFAPTTNMIESVVASLDEPPHQTERA
jgi:putative flippase GtrA